jgi:polysaccharide export outer membrane protein
MKIHLINYFKLTAYHLGMGFLLLGLSGCGSLPSAGPSTSKILSRAKQEGKSAQSMFTLVKVSDSVIRAQGEIEGVGSGFHGKGNLKGNVSISGLPAVEKIEKGDVVGVTIYTTGGGLFGSGQSGIAQSVNIPGMSGGHDAGGTMGAALPSQIVDSSEAITVPYVGRVKVVGREPHEVENEIAERMKGMAFTPYAIVSIGSRFGGDLVTVTGDVKNPQRMQVPMAGLRIADAVTVAGGSVGRDYETQITLIRGAIVQTGLYSELLKDPASNIYLHPNDTMVVKVRPWTYTTFGATGQTTHPFQMSRMSIAEALGASNGLDDNRANPGAVFIYRLESTSVLKKLGGVYHQSCPGGVPVIYQLNLRDPNGFFLARQFPIRDKDLIYVGNAGTIGIQKVMGIIGSLTSPVVTGLSATSGVAGVKTLTQ